ncbi:MAG: transposase [Taibaiella sp.]|nr:transposase [Taibaiella sp.]
MLIKYDCTFFTATILEWKHALAEAEGKQIITDSLSFLVNDGRAYVNAFVIMDNHIHLIWHIREPHNREVVQRDFLRYTASEIIKRIRQLAPERLNEYRVNAADRKYQIWERNALSIALWSEEVLLQKINYLHQNPVRKGFCERPEDYKYSSAGYYLTGDKRYSFLTHFRYA